MNTVWQFATARQIKFGRGAIAQLADAIVQQKCHRPLIVTDPVVGALPSVAAAIIDLRRRGLAVMVFDQSEAEPAIQVAEAAVLAGQSAKCDCVVGIGGGSNLDVAKMAAIVLAHGGRVQDYFGFAVVPGPTLPVIALPTTAGTGSEVSHSAVLTDPEQATKVSTLSPYLRPTCALVDPALTDSCPPSVTGQSGIDALVHAVEAFTNRSYTEMVGVDPQARAYEGSYRLTRLLASEAIRLVGQHLVVAVQAPTAGARDGMAEAALLAGMAFSNSGVGIVHALEYPIGALTHCGHGEGNGLLLPHVMRYNLPHRIEDFAEIAQLLGADVDGVNRETAAELAIVEVVKLQEKTGIATKLRQFGMQRDAIGGVAEKAHGIRRLMDLNIQTPSLSDLMGILEAAY